MTEAEWKLKKELLATRQQLCQAQSQLLQKVFDDTTAELAALGPAWVDPALLLPLGTPAEDAVAH